MKDIFWMGVILILLPGCVQNQKMKTQFKAKEQLIKFIHSRTISLTGPDTWSPPVYISDFQYTNHGIFISDERTKQVSVHSLDGSFKKLIGGPGPGPMEYRYPNGVCVTGDRIHVFDMGKYIVYDEKGAFLFQNIDTEQIPKGIPGPMYPGPNGTVYMAIFSRYSPKASIHHMDSDGNLITKFSPPDGDFIRYWDQIWPGGFLVINEGKIYEMYNHRYQILVFNYEGKKEGTINLTSSIYQIPDYEEKITDKMEFLNKYSLISGFCKVGKNFVTVVQHHGNNSQYIEFWDEAFFGLGRVGLPEDERLIGSNKEELVYFNSDTVELIFRTPDLK